ncbi:MAG TPA: hypothetical protein VLL98_05160, partial [Rickettsiales bacterium]|nr:hypothetical protein [Rickettsiales bacterium]
IIGMIDGELERETKKLVENLQPYKKDWASNVKNTHYDFNETGKKIWASGTKSTNRWVGLNDVLEKNDIKGN